MQAARQLLQLLQGGGRLTLHRVEQPRSLLRRRVELPARELDQVAEREQPLLRAVVQVAPDAAALLVGRVDHTRA